MRIDGAGMDDHLKVTFTHLLERDCSKEFWIVISMANKDYEGKRPSELCIGAD